MAREKDQYSLPKSGGELTPADLDALDKVREEIHSQLCEARDLTQDALKKLSNIGQWITEQKIAAVRAKQA